MLSGGHGCQVVGNSGNPVASRGLKRVRKHVEWNGNVTLRVTFDSTRAHSGISVEKIRGFSAACMYFPELPHSNSPTLLLVQVAGLDHRHPCRDRVGVRRRQYAGLDLGFGECSSRISQVSSLNAAHLGCSGGSDTGIMVMLTATAAAPPTPARESKDGPRSGAGPRSRSRGRRVRG